MEKFIIEPAHCLILKALRDTSSLREAAALLSCDPAGLARNVQQISRNNGFVQKVNNRWQVTARGLDLVAWAEDSIQAQNKILNSKHSLRIASTMWFSEEIIIPNLVGLKNVIEKDSTLSFSVPDKGFELSLLEGSVDFVIVCHPPENPEIEHRQISVEDWVLIAPISWAKKFKGKNDFLLQQLESLPFIRHAHMNHNLLLPQIQNFKESGFVIDNLIGVRSAVREGLGWSLIPKFLVRRDCKEQKIFLIPYPVNITDRKVCLWWLRNRDSMKRQSVKIAGWLKEACA